MQGRTHCQIAVTLCNFSKIGPGCSWLFRLYRPRVTQEPKTAVAQCERVFLYLQGPRGSFCSRIDKIYIDQGFCYSLSVFV